MNYAIEVNNFQMNKIDEDDVVEAYISGSEDYIIPLVFPDYLIRIDILDSTIRVPLLGHAGALIINGKSGQTKYYEYGRYPPGDLGRTRKVSINNVKITSSKMIEISSFKKLLRQISANSGQRGNIRGAILRKENIYDISVEYCEQKIRENDDPERKPYSIYSNSCMTFVDDLLRYLGFVTPGLTRISIDIANTVKNYIFSIIPNTYMQEIQFYFSARDLHYYYVSDRLEVDY
ncbi:hypothetical protein J3U57_02330 [Gilliamella sp. B3464]|uniref:hypothetical protein n=1 Tax=unclassified Gilliamella TaxID=2685620 RepID=UPI0022697FF0|nr:MULTISPECIES: hypothetical protein [unclassified Gilliamella]MCX8711358.1 hypothetical protein [Gilliamella sp. B3468]MCX8750408.1 hypothetical protein [Gilliamella sp. B3464]